MAANSPKRLPRLGEIWDAILDPNRGHEQAGYRPVLLISTDQFNSLHGSLIIVVPLTGTEPRVRYHIPVKKGEGGLAKDSAILPEQIRAIDVSRLRGRRGRVSQSILEDARRMVFALLSD